MKIALIGSGKVAGFLGLAFKKHGHRIELVYSRNEEHARSLAMKLGCRHTSDKANVAADAEICVMAITEDATAPFLQSFDAKNKILIHTSGSLPMNILSDSGTKDYGVLYPMFSFSGNNLKPGDKPKKPEFGIPVFLEASSKAVDKKITALAGSISDNLIHIRSDQRQVLHIAAVFANNFSNHMYHLSERILAEKGLSFQLLLPMIEEATQRLKNESPADIQTGPAYRGDKKTLARQLKYLDDHPDLAKIYKQISSSIVKHKK